MGFSINNKGYLGTGYDPTHVKDFWEYTPDMTAIYESTVDIKFILYPIPVYDFMTISYKNLEIERLTIEIINTLGKTIDKYEVKGSTHAESITINLSKLQNGLYIVRLLSDGLILNQKFIKQ